MHSAMFMVQCAMCNVHGTMYNMHSAMFMVQFPWCNIHRSAMCKSQCVGVKYKRQCVKGNVLEC